MLITIYILLLYHYLRTGQMMFADRVFNSGVFPTCARWRLPVLRCDSPLSPTLPAAVLLVPDPAPGRGACPGPPGAAGAAQGPGVFVTL